MEQTTDILDVFKTLWGRRSFIVCMTMLATLVAVVVSFLIPPTYKAQAVILPIGGQKGGGLTAMVSQMGFGSLLGGLGGGSGSSTQIMAVLKSRTLAERLIENYDLSPHLFPRKWDMANKRWKKGKPPLMEESVEKFYKKVKFIEDKKNQTITISAILRDPEAAARAVNGALRELEEDINANTFTVAKRNRIFISEQLERSKADLLEAGKEIASYYSANRISNSIPKVDVDVKTPGGANSEVLKDIQAQIDDVNKQLEGVRVVRDVPQQVYLQYLMLRQELLGKVNALLTQQYEMAKIDENKEDITFQVIDEGRVPVRRYAPRRTQITASTFLVSGVASCFFVLLADRMKKGRASDGKHTA